MAEPMPGVKVGDWVQVWAQVIFNDSHPEDITVRLESHSDQYSGLVRRDRVVVPNIFPPFVETCSAVYEHEVFDLGPSEDSDFVLLRCTKHEGHSGRHRHRGTKWEDHLSYGDVEER